MSERENEPILKASDLPEELQTKIFELSKDAVSTYKIEKDIATYLKKELDQLYGATWHVIVGKSFGSYVTHEQGYFTYFYIGQLAFLIFKSGWFETHGVFIGFVTWIQDMSRGINVSLLALHSYIILIKYIH